MARRGTQVKESNGAAYLASALPLPAPRRLVVLCPPRSGSELLVDLLDQVPGLACSGEVLHQRKVRSLRRFLEGRARLARLGGARAYGCKVLTHHLLPEEDRFGPAKPIVQGLIDSGWTVVQLRRRDVLAMALSHLQAQETGRWHERGDTAPEELPRIDADPGTVFAWLHAADSYQRWLDDLLADLPHHTVTYEDDLLDDASRQAAVDAIARLVGLEPAPVAARLRKGAPPDPWQRLQDPEPLRRLLRETAFADLADGGDPAAG
jgi:LPS sulfotransferase NodH